MILVGPARMIHSPGFSNAKVSERFIYNFTSLAEWIPRSILVPYDTLGATDEYDFDIRYRDWLMMDNARFVEIFNIASENIKGNDIFIAISDMNEQFPFLFNLVESFLKFMQSRYGTRSLYINSEDDWDIYIHDTLDTNVIMQDPYILQDDFMRYCSLVQYQE